MKKFILFAIILLLLCNNVRAKQFTVCADGCDFKSIQEAINSASDGDTIFIKSGIYKERINIKNKSITLQGEGKEDTIIDAELKGSGITIYIDNNGEGDVSISNLKIINGKSENGGGIYIKNSYNSLNINLTNLHIEGNIAADKGGGVYVYYNGGSIKVIINKCLIFNNNAKEGGGIYGYRSEILVQESNIKGNNAISGGGIYDNYSQLTVASSIIRDNTATESGGGIETAGDITIKQSWILNNISSEGGGINFCDRENVNLVVLSSIIAFNRANKGGGIALSYYYHSAIIKNSTIFGNSAENGKGIYAEGGDLQIYNSCLCNKEDSKTEDLYCVTSETSKITIIALNNSFCALPQYISSENNIEYEPEFIAPEDMDFSLKEDSSLIGKGNKHNFTGYDIAGAIRDDEPDIGACEYPSVCKLGQLEPAVNVPSEKVKELSAEIKLVLGWNLVGIPIFEQKDISSIFENNLSKVFMLWKWDKESGKWKLYTSDESIRNYIQSMPLPIELIEEDENINPGEGFWVNANSPFSLKFKGYEIIK